MANIKEIVEIEKQRSDMSTARVIHLFAEGSFYRAYEWSAWLFVSKIKAFKISHKNYKGIEDSVAMIGFPTTSLDGVIPEGGDVVAEDDKRLDVILPDSVIPPNYEVSLMAHDFEDWKKNLPASEAQKEGKSKDTALPHHADFSQHAPTMTELMHRVLVFNVNQKTPFECMQFITEIQQKLLSIL